MTAKARVAAPPALAPRVVEGDRLRPRGGDLVFSAGLFVAALLPRLYVAIAWPREPVWDGHYYDFGARRIAAGLGYSDDVMGAWHPWCHWPVGFSGALAAAYRIFGAHARVATVFNAVIGALLAVTIHRLARYGLGLWRARAAGALVAAFPGLIVYSALVMSEPLSALALVVAGWAWLRDRAGHPRRGAAWCGLALGLGTLVHPSFLAYAPALLVIEWACLRDEGRALSVASGARFDARPAARAAAPVFGAIVVASPLREAALRAVIATACALVPVAPWTLRNCRVMDRCTLVSTNGGWNLAIGAFERATGRFETLRSTDGCRVVTGQVQQDACWRDLALAAIRRDPVRWLALMPQKLAYTFDHESFPIEYLHEADPDRWPEDRRTQGRAWLTMLHRLLLSAAAFGVVARPFRRPAAAARRGWRGLHAVRWTDLATLGLITSVVIYAWASDAAPFWLIPLATAALGSAACRGAPATTPVVRWALLCLLGTIATHAVFFGEDRYHVVVTPMLCLLAAGAFRAHAEPSALHLQRSSLSS